MTDGDRLAPALDTLAALRKKSAGSFDLAFIDADKSNYRNYYEAVLDLLRPGGAVLIDNVLWSGDVADPSVKDEETTVLRDLNRFIATDTREMLLPMYPIVNRKKLSGADRFYRLKQVMPAP